MNLRIKRRLRQAVKRITHLGKARYCPICKRYSSHFDPSGITRPDSRCPFCGSVKRHRLIWLVFKHKTCLFSENPPQHFLHIAPESFFEKRFRKMLGRHRYVTADLLMPAADVKMDITDIQYPDSSWDLIYCSDVLEHVDDDRKAMSELYRVLSEDGLLVISVPITAEITFEDPSVTSPEERMKLFGQDDHVRRYGPDIEDRLRNAGFSVEPILDTDLCSEEEIKFMALPPRPVFLCRK